MNKLLPRGPSTWEMPEPSLPPALAADIQRAAIALTQDGSGGHVLDLCTELALKHPSSPEIMSLMARISDDTSDLPMAVIAGSLAHQLYKNRLPAGFNLGTDVLPGYLDGNRPMLDNARSLADLYEETGALRACRELCEWTLKIDPSDEYGLRTLLPKIYMQEKNTIGMARLARSYPDDYAPEILLGTLYFSIITADSRQEQIWQDVQAQFPLLADELLKTIHAPPKDYDPSIGYYADTAETAWSYWDFYGQLWLENPRTKAFLTEKRSSK